MLNPNFALRDQGVSSAVNLDLLARHRWYFVKEGFSPRLVEAATEAAGLLAGSVVIDPFSGSGTVPVVSSLLGFKALAFEVNPFLRFLSATKLKQVSPKQFLLAGRKLLKILEKPVVSMLENQSTFTEGNRWNRWLFPTSVLRSFEAGKKSLPSFSREQRDLLKLALLRAAMDSCNATRDGKCLRYKKDWKDKEASASQFRHTFETRINEIGFDLAVAKISNNTASIIQGDARRLVLKPMKEKFDLCVTSPPYLNSFDYSDVYRPELFLGDFVSCNETLMKVRLKTVRSHVQAKWIRPIRDDFGQLYEDCVKKLRDDAVSFWNPRIPLMVQAYFEDLEIILRSLRSNAKSQASLWLVVSTSAYGGIEIPVDLILAEIGQRSGWFLREVGVLRYLRSSSQHVKHLDDSSNKSVPLRESVIILDASRKAIKRIN